MDNARVEEILRFWFGDVPGPYDVDSSRSGLWFGKSEEVDREIAQRFGQDVESALRGELDGWAVTARGRLGLVILLDQLTRNAFRGTPRAFEGDERALALSLAALDGGQDRELAYIERVFLYMPLQHSESPEMQDRSVRAFRGLVEEIPAEHRATFAGFADYAEKHAVIIRRFGRYPHRNRILGRESTAEEAAFLEQPGSSF